MFSRPKASLFVPLCLKPETQLSWFGMSIPGRKLRLTFILTAKTRGLFCREWLITFRSEEHTSELQSLMRISYAVFCLKKKKTKKVVLLHRYTYLISIDI